MLKKTTGYCSVSPPVSHITKGYKKWDISVAVANGGGNYCYYDNDYDREITPYFNWLILITIVANFYGVCIVAVANQ